MYVCSVENSLSTLVGIYTGNDPELQLEAAWCITNISAGTHQHAQAITKFVAPYLVTYLSSSIHQLQVTHQHAQAITKFVAPYLVTYLSSSIHQLQVLYGQSICCLMSQSMIFQLYLGGTKMCRRTEEVRPMVRLSSHTGLNDKSEQMTNRNDLLVRAFLDQFQ